MARKILISARNFEVEAVMLEDERPRTCEEMWEALPIEGEATIYKEEIYFDIPVNIEPEDATPDTEKGDVSYWHDGPGFCVFFGDSQPVSPVNTFAKIGDDIEKFREVEEGDEVVIQKTTE